MNLNVFGDFQLPVCAARIKCGVEWEIKDATETLCRTLGYEKEELISFSGGNRSGLFFETEINRFEEGLELAAEGQEVPSFLVRLLTAEGKVVWMNVAPKFVGVQNAVPFVDVVFYDVSRQKELETELNLLHEQYAVVDELTTDLPFDLDVVRWMSHYPKQIYTILGKKQGPEWRPFSESVNSLVHPVDREEFVRAMKEATMDVVKGTVDYRINISSETVAPKYVWFRTYYRSVLGEDNKIERIVGRTHSIDQDKVLQDAARRDPLTQLLNAGEVRREIKEYMEGDHNKKGALFIIDIDNFKQINDTFGHTYGDNVIVETANIIRDQFRQEDIVGRIGGDEFVALMKEDDLQLLKNRAQQLCQKLERAYTGGMVTKHISGSVGIAILGKDGVVYEHLFEKADHAMYRAKTGGKNGFEFANDLDVGPIRTNAKENDSRTVLQKDDQDFLMLAVSLMAHARNIDGSLNLLLKRIAARCDLSLVAIFEENEKHNTITLTNYYSDLFHFYERMEFSRDGFAATEIPVGKVSIIDAKGAEDGDKSDSTDNVFDNTNLSVVGGRFEFVGTQTGIIYFLSTDEKRVWDDSELQFMEELMRIISIYVALRYRMGEGDAKVRHLQRRDQLTGLYNLEGFKRRITTILNRKKRGHVYAIEYLDINNFGYVNENYGYQVGDNALKIFASDITEKPFFEAGCRLYSDFFVILLSGEDKDTLVRQVNVSHKKFSNMQNHQFPSSSISISAGWYWLDDENVDIEQAVENATLAWKKAKGERKQEIVFFDEKYRKKRLRQRQIVGEFYEALYRDDFQIFLQPKFCLGDGKVYGAEALARWQLPDGSIIPPSDFMEPLEKIGYITELDYFIFEELLKRMSLWKKRGVEEMTISTNFSGRHFEGDGEEFLQRMEFLLSKYDVPPRLIEIEITESVMVKNIGVLKKCIDELHRIGFRVAIDDFGTGFSSLSVMMDIHADVIKMDKSFLVNEMTPTRQEFLVLIEKMIETTGKEALFEGIESKEQEEFLLSCGYRYGQGYLCDAPLSIADFEQKYMK